MLASFLHQLYGETMQKLNFSREFNYPAQPIHDILMDANRFHEVHHWIKSVQHRDLGNNTLDISFRLKMPMAPGEIQFDVEQQSHGKNHITANVKKGVLKTLFKNVSLIDSMDGQITLTEDGQGKTRLDCAVNYQPKGIAAGMFQSFVAMGFNPVMKATTDYMQNRLDHEYNSTPHQP